MSAQVWTTKHDKPQDGWTVDFDFFDAEGEDIEGFEDVRDCGSQGVFDESGAAICFVVSVPYDHDRLSRHSSLIASAPSMASVLAELVAFDDADFDNIGQMQDVLTGVIAKARAALAQAGAAQ